MQILIDNPYVLVLFGLGLLILGSHFFIEGTASTAHKYQISPLITGLILVGFFTSAPEILVGVEAALFEDRTNIAVGNAIGSNIANIGLIVGLTALFFSIKINARKTLQKLYGLMCLAMLPPFLLMYVGSDLTRLDSIILLLCLATSFYLLMKIAKNVSSNDPINNQYTSEMLEIENEPTIRLVLKMVISLAALLIGASILLDGAIDIAKIFGVSDLVIGLTIVAVGTSLPEVATSIMSLVKKKYEIALGNIIGSNMFNMLAVLGFPALITPVYGLDPKVITRDFATMVVMTGIFAVMLFWISRNKVTRFEGIILLLLFALYQFAIYNDTVGA